MLPHRNNGVNLRVVELALALLGLAVERPAGEGVADVGLGEPGVASRLELLETNINYLAIDCAPRSVEIVCQVLHSGVGYTVNANIGTHGAFHSGLTLRHYDRRIVVHAV
jgi:hypothetical protein